MSADGRGGGIAVVGAAPTVVVGTQTTKCSQAENTTHRNNSNFMLGFGDAEEGSSEELLYMYDRKASYELWMNTEKHL